MVSQFGMSTTKSDQLKNGEFYFVLIMKLRRGNLRQMMNQGLVSDEIRRQVLKGLKQLIVNDDTHTSNGDLKERV